MNKELDELVATIESERFLNRIRDLDLDGLMNLRAEPRFENECLRVDSESF